MLWAYQIIPRVLTRETPFSLAFGTKVVISIKIVVPLARHANYDKQTNLKKQLVDLDLIDDVQEKACIRMAAYQYKVTRYLNAKVRGKAFKVGDLVLL